MAGIHEELIVGCEIEVFAQAKFVAGLHVLLAAISHSAIADIKCRGLQARNSACGRRAILPSLPRRQFHGLYGPRVRHRK